MENLIRTLIEYTPRTLIEHTPRKLKTLVKNYIISRSMLVPVEQLNKAYAEAIAYLKKKGTLGDYLEFGVFRGDSLACMFGALDKSGETHVRLFGFDSFEGLPDISDSEDKPLPWYSGQFKSSLKKARKRLNKAGVDKDRLFLIKGWYADTLNNKMISQYKIRKASLIMIDCDLYSSTKLALNFCAPLIQDQAILFFDDWSAGVNLDQENLGEKKAFYEFLKANPQFTSKEFGSYYHTETKSKQVAKIFLVTRK